MKLIHYADKMELAKLIVTSAPPKALWFNVVKKLAPSGVLVDYEPPTTRYSLRVLADELGLVGQGMPAKREPVSEPLHYTPSREASLAAQEGKRGFVLLA